ncbi:dynamin family protein [Enterobacter sp.]|uniref:dynamin family protein n=1 Tax=Enterobacter sp. TaxID=42895 RepID=UPI00296F89A1|nr:dynamin family protein [Enterobacter sp.]
MMTSLKKRVKRKNKTLPSSQRRGKTIPVNIIVAATMSAGKTSLINALLGQELLWSANEAATATITRIHHSTRIDGITSGVSFTADGECHEIIAELSSETLHQWNAHQKVKYIELNANVAAFTTSVIRPIIYDTPGANNSQDLSHAALLKEAFDECSAGLIVYVLNATQPATNDDALLLTDIRQRMNDNPHYRIIFVLNKVDELDEEKGERLCTSVVSIEKYLQRLGFINPVIIPAMMQASLIARKIINRHAITRVQRNRLRNELARFRANKHALNDAALMPQSLKNALNMRLRPLAKQRANVAQENEQFSDSELRQFTAYSGLQALELYLDNYR